MYGGESETRPSLTAVTQPYMGVAAAAAELPPAEPASDGDACCLPPEGLLGVVTDVGLANWLSPRRDAAADGSSVLAAASAATADTARGGGDGEPLREPAAAVADWGDGEREMVRGERLLPAVLDAGGSTPTAL